MCDFPSLPAHAPPLTSSELAEGRTREGSGKCKRNRTRGEPATEFRRWGPAAGPQGKCWVWAPGTPVDSQAATGNDRCENPNPVEPPGPEEKANYIDTPLFMNHSRLLPQDFVEQERSLSRSRYSHDSEDSLTALELPEGGASTAHHRARSLSGSSFGFERHLLPLSASLSESEEVRSASGEKTIGFINGTLELSSR